ncbi:MAG: hypothetical protein K5873_12400 [Treponema sp.]|nr:hypothetical protein [Treponema sp.]
MRKNFTLEKASCQESSIFNLWQKNKSDTGINLAFGFKSENLDIGRLENAFNQIVSRHDRLRSIFLEKDGTVYRKILPSLTIKLDAFTSKNLRDFIQPFNLEEGPLIHIAYQENTVFLDICHIVTDGFSMAILFSELNDFYSGKKVSHLAPTIAAEDEEKVKANTDFWAGYFQKPFKNLLLPADKSGKRSYGGDGNALLHSVNASLTKKIQSFCRNLAITPFILYFSAFLIFLYKVCGEEEVVTTTNLSCRSSKNIRSIGLLGTVAPIRMKLSPEMMAGDFLQKVNLYFREVMQHQNFDSEKLLNKTGFSDLRDFSRTTFTFEHPKMADIKLDGKNCTYVPIPSLHSQSDLTLCFFPFKSEGKILAIFRSDLFSLPQVRRFIRKYLNIAKKILDEKTKIRDL